MFVDLHSSAYQNSDSRISSDFIFFVLFCITSVFWSELISLWIEKKKSYEIYFYYLLLKDIVVNIMENKIIFVYDLLSGVRVPRENESRWHCPWSGPVCCKTCEHSFTGFLGYWSWGLGRASSIWGVWQPLAAGVRSFHPGGGDSRSRGLSSEYLGTDLCKDLRTYWWIWG